MHQEFVDLVNDDKHYYHRAFYWGDFMRREKLLLLFPFCLISCATPQAPVPADYQSYNCSQLGAELQLVNSKISDGENQQNRRRHDVDARLFRRIRPGRRCRSAFAESPAGCAPAFNDRAGLLCGAGIKQRSLNERTALARMPVLSVLSLAVRFGHIPF
jgi:hypothetical protein